MSDGGSVAGVRTGGRAAGREGVAIRKTTSKVISGGEGPRKDIDGVAEERGDKYGGSEEGGRWCRERQRLPDLKKTLNGTRCGNDTESMKDDLPLKMKW